MNVQPYNRIFICLTGRGAKTVKQMLRERGVSVFTYSDLTKQELQECFGYKKTLCDQPKALKRLQVIVNEEKNVTNKVLKNYNILVYVEDRTAIPNNTSMIHLRNTADYFIDYRERDGTCANQLILSSSVDELVRILMKNMK